MGASCQRSDFTACLARLRFDDAYRSLACQDPTVTVQGSDITGRTNSIRTLKA